MAVAGAAPGARSLMGVAPGTKAVAALPVPGGAGSGVTEVQALVACGARNGPWITVLGGVHGDEYEGVAAAAAVWRSVDPARLRGRLLVVPVCNPAAFATGTRAAPEDQRDLARTFPGRAEGSLTERVAHVLAEAAIRPADFLIDLHSAGQHFSMPLLCGSYSGDDVLGQRCRAAALAFGAPLYWAHPEVAPGRSLSVALAADIPCLYAECGGGGRIRPPDLRAYVLGVRRVLAHLGALPPSAARPAGPPRLVLESSGNLDLALTVSHAGLLIPRVRPLDRVEDDQPLGDVVDERGAHLETLRADRSGVVVMARRTARVRPGDGAYVVAPLAPGAGDRPA